MKGRYGALVEHVQDGNAARVLAELKWFWSGADGDWGWERLKPEFIALLKSAIDSSAAVRAEFLELRDAVAPKGDRPRGGMPDWLALNDALAEPATTLSWFDEQVSRGAVPVTAWSRLEQCLLDRGRAADLLQLYESPLSEVTMLFDGLLDDDALEPLPVESQEYIRDRTRFDAARVLKAVEAGCPEQTESIRAAILARDGTDRMRTILELSFDALRHDD